MPPLTGSARIRPSTLRDRRPAVPPADPAARPARDHGLGLRLGRPPRHVQLPGLHHRGQGRPAGPGQVDQRPGRRATADFLPHLLPVDPTLHWANPPGGTAGRDTPPDVHLHARPVHRAGADRHPPARRRTAPRRATATPRPGTCPRPTTSPPAIATGGLVLRRVQGQVRRTARRQAWDAGHGDVPVPQRPAGRHVWFHDHTLGMTRLNVYAGPAGFYLLRGGPADLPPGVLPGPAPRSGDPPGTRYYEIPIAIQDRSSTPTARCSTRPAASSSTTSPARTSRQRRLADLEPGVLRQHHGGQRPHLAALAGRAAPLPAPLPQRLQLPLPDPQDRHRSRWPTAGQRPRCRSGRSAPTAASCPRRCSSTSC